MAKASKPIQSKANNYYAKAIETEDIIAMVMLGRRLIDGEGVKANPVEGENYYDKQLKAEIYTQ